MVIGSNFALAPWNTFAFTLQLVRMLNYIWLVLIALAVLIGGFTGKIGDVNGSVVESANLAQTIAFALIAVMTLWLGLMRLAEKSGLVNYLGLALRPIMVWLFPEVPPDHPAMGAIILNVAANILGLNNAATPMGLRAMRELNSLNKRPGIATNAMCMLLAINTSSITLIPVTVIALLAQYHSKNPTAIIGTSLAATAIAHAAAILSCKLLERLPFFKLPPLSETEIAPVPASVTNNNVVQSEAEASLPSPSTDTPPPFVKGSAAVLGVTALLFILMLATTAFPELIHRPPSDAEAAHAWPLRIIDAVSILAIPWLVVFFPLFAALRRIPVYDEFVEGGKEGFQVVIRILPYIVAMVVAVGMFKASGGLLMITNALSPISNALQLPPQLVPMAMIRPFSSGAAYGLLTDLVKTNGADSLIALTGATFYGCSETTFYVIAVYFGSVGIRKTRHAIAAGLVADVICPIASVLICRAVFSQ